MGLRTSLLDAFSLDDENGIVSIVGAGGKTTLMFRLAKELAGAGKRVLTTTTTKIFYPTIAQSSHVIISSDPHKILRQAGRMEETGSHTTAAADQDRHSRKLIGYAPDVISALWNSGRFHWIIVEADGAAGRPLKAPAPHEPVISEETTVQIAVVGLDVLGKPLSEKWVFRPTLFADITGLTPGEMIAPAAVCTALLHSKGIMKGCPSTARQFVFLNKAETEIRRVAGQKIGRILKKSCRGKIGDVFMGSLEEEAAAVQSLFAPSASVP